MAAVLAGGPGAVLSHRSAAALWGIRGTAASRIEITVPTRTRHRPGISASEGRLAPDEVTTHHGIPITTPPRTLLDLAIVLTPHRLERALDQAEHLRLTDPVPLDALVARHPGRRGTKALKEILEKRTLGDLLTRSELEDRFLAFLDAHDIPRPITNARIGPYEVDAHWPAARLVAELDGFAAHGTRAAFERDRARDRALQATGHRVVRITWRQLRDDTTTLASQLRDLHWSPSMISTNQFKNGNHIEVDGTVFKILEFQHVKPGKGGAFVRTKLRRAADGNVIDKTFRAGEKFRAVRTEARKMTFLYSDGTDAHFMDAESYEQLAVPESGVAEALRWTKANDAVDVLFIDGDPGDLQLPASVVLEVSETEPGLRGDTASGGGTKPATLETGATINVPLFVNVGDRVKVDTRSGDYMSRA